MRRSFLTTDNRNKVNKLIGVIYSAVDGHTLKIYEFLADFLREKHCCVHVYSIGQFENNLFDFDRLVIGASV